MNPQQRDNINIDYFHSLIPNDFEYLGKHSGFHPIHGEYMFALYRCPHGYRFAVNSFDSEEDIKHRLITCWGHK